MSEIIEKEVCIIGAGPAGLQAALVLGRSLREIAVIDSNKPRHRATKMSHGLISRDYTPPFDLRAACREDFARYKNIDFIWANATEILGQDGDFIIKTQGIRGSNPPAIHAKKLLIASGLEETLPNIKGLLRFYGSVIFPCVACDAWELQNKKLIILGTSAESLNIAIRARQYSDSITFLSNSANKAQNDINPNNPDAYILSNSEKELLNSYGIEIIDSAINRLEGEKDILQYVYFENGSKLDANGGFIQPILKFNSTIYNFFNKYNLIQRGENPAQIHSIRADGYGKTKIQGVYAAGDILGYRPSQIALAIGSGSAAGIGLNNEMIFEKN